MADDLNPNRVVGPRGGAAARLEEWLSVNNLSGLTPREVASLAFDVGHEFHHESTDSHWRCFHCGEVFTHPDAAQEHFGHHEGQQALCTIDAAHFRWMEAQHRRNVDDDSEALRAIGRLTCEHERLRREAEELGYARGLRDAKKYPGELGLRPDLTAHEKIAAGLRQHGGPVSSAGLLYCRLYLDARCKYAEDNGLVPKALPTSQEAFLEQLLFHLEHWVTVPNFAVYRMTIMELIRRARVGLSTSAEKRT